MNVGLALEIDATIDHLSPAIVEIDAVLKQFFSSKSYGDDVANIYVGVILTTPESERLHKVRKLKYKKTVIIRIPGHVIELKNVIEYDIKPDYAHICRLSTGMVQANIADLLIKSVEILEQNHAKFSNFDTQAFKDDLKHCLSIYAVSMQTVRPQCAGSSNLH